MPVTFPQYEPQAIASRTLFRKMGAGLVATLLALGSLALGAAPVQAQSTPTVTGVAVTSNAGSDSTYVRGDTIEVTLTFSEAVTVTGTPRLRIDMDPAHWGTKWAHYSSGSGTTQLVFAHTVVRPNISTQGIAVLANTLTLNRGTIRASDDSANANLAHTGLSHDSAHKVNWRLTATSPTVTGVAVTSNAGSDSTYAYSETIEVTLTFSEAVTVTGTPRLRIDMDPAHWGTKWAAYNRGSGTTQLVFAYTVVWRNISNQGIAVLANTLVLNRGTIRASDDSANANLAHTGLGHDSNHKVHWKLEPVSTTPPATSPTVTGVAVTSNAGSDSTYALGDTIEVTLTFSEAVNVTGRPRLLIDMDPAHWGTKWAAYNRGSGTTQLIFAHTVVRPNISRQGIAVLENRLTLNQGTITATDDGANASLAHSGLAHDSNHKVNWRLTG